jgi:hypothetical protein
MQKMPEMTRLKQWQSKLASGAGLFGKSIRPEKITTPAQDAEQGSNKRSGIAYRGTGRSPKIWQRRWMKTEIKFYLVYGLVGILIASMVRTLSEPRNKINQPTKEEEKWQ